MPVRLSTVLFLCVCVVWTLALPKEDVSKIVSSGGGEIPDERPRDDHPFDGPLGKGSPGHEVFNNYDLDSEEGAQMFPEYEADEIPFDRTQGGVSERPLGPGDRIPEDEYPEEEAKEQPEQIPTDEEEESRGPEEDDTHAVEDEKKPDTAEEEETMGSEGEIDLPFKPSLFNFHQVNHYIKKLESAMDHVFKDALEDAALLNNTFANTTEEEVDVNGHKYKVQKSIVKTGDEDTNSTLFVEAVSSVNEDKQKNRSERSNPDAESIQ